VIDVAGSLFVGAASLLLGILVIDMLWDARSVTEKPFTMATSEAIREYYYNNLIYMAKRTPQILAPMPLAFLTVVGSLSYKLVHGMRAGDSPATTSALVSIGLTFPIIVVAAASTIPTLSRIDAERATLTLQQRHLLQRRIYRQHVLYFTCTVVAIAVQFVL
jgi:hypothetical protein